MFYQSQQHPAVFSGRAWGWRFLRVECLTIHTCGTTNNLWGVKAFGVKLLIWSYLFEPHP